MILDKEFRNKKSYYFCECDLCRTRKWIRVDSIKSGKSQSCGCLAKNTQFKKHDLTGQIFERLKVIKEAGQKDGRYVWECECECGNKCLVDGANLVTEKTKSCGCLAHEKILENQKRAFEAYTKKNLMHNTNIAVINKDKPISTNKSGVTGVSWDTKREKWIAQIVFQGTTYHLGRYENKEDAIRAREAAEEKLHKIFLEYK